MATFNKINDFVFHLAEKVHDFANDQLVVALSDTVPGSETPTAPTADGGGVLANVTQAVYTNLSGTNPRNLTVSSSSQTGGTYRLVINDLTLTASGGSVGPFRYVYIYNDTATAASDGYEDPLIGYYDYGSSLTLADGESLTIDFDATNGVLTLV